MFASEKYVRVHIENEHKKIRHRCDHCGETFALRDTLRRHVKREHLGGKKRYECEICGKVYTRKPNLDEHRRHVHINPKRSPGGAHKCDQCSRSYPTRRNLTRHKRDKHRKQVVDVADLSIAPLLSKEMPGAKSVPDT